MMNTVSGHKSVNQGTRPKTYQKAKINTILCFKKHEKGYQEQINLSLT